MLRCVCTGPGNVAWSTLGTVVTCEVPEGVGVGWVVYVYARQTVGYLRVQTLGFLPPRLSEATPAEMPTTGGVVTIYGANFGSPALVRRNISVTVQVRSVFCTVRQTDPDVVSVARFIFRELATVHWLVPSASGGFAETGTISVFVCLSAGTSRSRTAQ